MLDDLLSEEGAEGAVVFCFPRDVMGLPPCCIVVGHTDEGCCAAGGMFYRMLLPWDTGYLFLRQFTELCLLVFLFQITAAP